MNIKKLYSFLSNSKRGYTNSFLKGECFEIGDFIYGIPEIFLWGEISKLKIGKFCSIAEGVKIFLGGNHRIDWISTYPFMVFSNE